MKISNKRYYKFILLLTIVFAVGLTGCGEDDLSETVGTSENFQPAEVETTTTEALNKQLDIFLARVDNFKSPIREYGVSRKIIINEGDLLASVDYPEGDIETLNQICREWAENILSIYHDDDFDHGELIVKYNSYVSNENYASVEFYGEFISDLSDVPTKLCATFNADKSTGQIVKLSDIATERELSLMTAYVLDQTGLTLSEIDDEILNKWLILEGGIQINLMEGKYLPSQEGIKKILITKEKIAKFKVQDNDIVTESNYQNSTEAQQNDFQQATDPAIVTVATENTTEATTAPVIALTFDDGPSNDTWRLIDLLNTYDVKATFFILGQQINDHQDVLNYMAQSGHELATHSWDHREFTRLNNDQITSEIMDTRAKLYEVTGVDALAVRPPYGSFNDRVRSVAAENGVYFINWNVDPLDWQSRNTEAIVNAILNDARDGAIILSHDIHPETVDAYAIVLPILIERGFEFKTASDLIVSGGRDLVPGVVYFSR